MVTAVDINGAFIEENQTLNREFSSITYMKSDVMDISFEGGTFDLIFASGIFMYLDGHEIEVLAQRLYHWLEKDGHLFFRESLSPFKDTYQSTYALLHPFSYYQELFETLFTLVNVGSLKSHTELFADPFRCFLLFRKDCVERNDKLI